MLSKDILAFYLLSEKHLVVDILSIMSKQIDAISACEHGLRALADYLLPVYLFNTMGTTLRILK